MKYRVVSITKKPDRYPESVDDTLEFPELVARVEDEQELFVIDEERNAWPACDFFYETDVKEFEAE